MTISEMTISEFIAAGARRIAEAGIQCADPALHMKQILQFVLKMEAGQIYACWNEPLSSTAALEAEGSLQKRLSGTPFQYLVGYEWFWDAKFSVGPGVLIPRRETELIVEHLLKDDRENLRVGELGAGCGNIGISVLSERRSWVWHAFEKNPQSLPYLTANVKSLLPDNQNFQTHGADFFESADDFAPYDWVVANPPYIPHEQMAQLPLEVQHEPQMALDGGERGLEVLTELAAFSSRLLGSHGKVISEFGYGQSEEIRNIFLKHFDKLEVIKDLSGIPRTLVGQKGG